MSREQQAWEQALNVPSGWLFEADERQGSDNLYSEAGQRAGVRRDALGKTRRAVAARIGISVEVLSHWERVGAPTRIKEAQVTAWEQALEVEPGWLLGNPSCSVKTNERERIASTAPDVRSAIVDIAARLAAIRFEKLAMGAVRLEREQQSARIFTQRYGVDSPSGTSLAAIAKQHGVVESRISQILKALNTVARQFKIDAVVFRRIREQAQACLPCALPELEALLRPLLGDPLTIEDACRFSADILAEPLFALTQRRINGRPAIM
ncbi:MAG TPA: helix-turn-helix transcriptional regulator, partial [Paraburkholderia sp.]|uniref:helix-turn-helix domain-containing protein n=1 Tax=Paraburkholderia sp. TaxID=1926495 RepID=UPI002B48BB7C